jgi:polyvinyl alcohol dehydrogenase (cytochrome)
VRPSLFGASPARSTNANKECVMSRLPIACGMAILLLSVGRTALPVEFTNAASSNAFIFEFEAICATCHGDDVLIDRAPNRAALEAMAPERIYQSLTDGPMAQFVLDWPDDKKKGLATFITGRPFGGPGARSAASMPNRCASTSASSPMGQWASRNLDATSSARYQSTESAGIDKDQVSDLVLRWAFGLPDAGAMRAQPIVANGRVFVPSDNGSVYSIDQFSGCVHWSFDAGRPAVSSIVPATLQESGKDVVFFGDFAANVYSLDSKTGRLLWKISADDHKYAKITGAPVLDPRGNKLYVPIGSWEEGIALATAGYECCTSTGSVVALDVESGRTIWKTPTIPVPAKAVGKTSAGVQLYGPSGAGVWSSPTIDLKRNVLYVGTANGYTDVPDFGSSDAVIAFDLDTGERIWSTQLLAGDQNCGSIDMSEEELDSKCPSIKWGANDDVSGSPVLLPLPDGTELLVAGQESGRITALNPEDGAKVWVVQTGEDEGFPQGAGMGAASDGRYYYRPGAHSNGSGWMVALEPATGEIAWRTDLPKPDACESGTDGVCSAGLFGSATVIPGVVFAGGRDGVLSAFSTDDGSILWRFNTMRAFNTVNGVPARGGSLGGHGPAIAGGMVIIGSGYAVLDTTPGNVLLAFDVGSPNSASESNSP